MYCPNCATNNLEGARFCRSCGSDISLVPQALAGRLPEDQSIETDVEELRHRLRRRRRAPSLDKAIRNVFLGIAFLTVAIILSFTPMGRFWWYWMLIPAFSMLGGGVADWVRIKQSQPASLPSGSMPPALSAQQQRAGEFPARNTAELVMPPPSVTEGTTRLLEDEAPTRHIGRAVENPASKSREES
jgi:hypothetical protein